MNNMPVLKRVVDAPDKYILLVVNGDPWESTAKVVTVAMVISNSRPVSGYLFKYPAPPTSHLRLRTFPRTRLPTLFCAAD